MVVERRVVSSILLLGVLASCGGESGEDDGAADATQGDATQGDDAPTSSDDGPTSGDSGDVVDGGLFDCGVSIDCSLFAHVGTEGDTECAGALAISTEPGVILFIDAPGGADTVYHSLVVMRGDGTAVVQERETENADEFGMSDGPWSPASVQQLCTVVPGEGQVEACGPDGGEDECQWAPIGGAEHDPEFCCDGGLADCQPIETPYDCDSLAALLEGDGTTG
jgi:hypothetical protein